MPNKAYQAPFDPKTFLAIVGEGKTILEFRKDQVVFAQGDAADTVFYIQKGRVRLQLHHHALHQHAKTFPDIRGHLDDVQR